MSVELVTALIAGGVSLGVSVISHFLQMQRLRAEMRTEFQAEETIHELLRHRHWRSRKFDTIRGRIRGFDDNDLRQKLVGAGAVSFMRKDKDGQVVEWWGLRKRVRKEIDEVDDEVNGTDNASVASPRTPSSGTKEHSSE